MSYQIEAVVAAEQAVLCSILLEGSLFKNVTLQPKHFYEKAHQVIFQAIEQVSQKAKDIDAITVATELKDNLENIGGLSYLSDRYYHREFSSALPHLIFHHALINSTYFNFPILP